MGKIKSLAFRIKKKTIKKYWRKHNKHNNTQLGKISNLEAIEFVKDNGIIVGKNTYGTINVNYTLGEKERLIIGNNCSIGRCEFLLGGEHDYKCVSTFPFNGRIALSKGPIVVEDDVWIGDGVWIMSGITIGKGSVIGTGSIVTHDIPPYAIVGGNPAKVIKYRFSQEIINRIKEVDLSRINTSDERVFDLLETHITDKNVNTIIEELEDK